MHDDTEPQNVQFHEHVEVIDFSTCSIDIQPENLPTKQIWSKKYPIRIRTNTRKPHSTQKATNQMQATSLTTTPQAASVDSSVAKMICIMWDLSALSILDQCTKFPTVAQIVDDNIKIDPTICQTIEKLLIRDITDSLKNQFPSKVCVINQ